MLIESLVKELEHKTDYLGGEFIETIYFGGGTPSVLSIDEINLLLSKIFSLYKVKSMPEITFEVNPDDLNKTYLVQLYKETAINRLSIGIQSFINRDLELLNRRHDAKKALDSVENALETGFSNLSIDLIYAIPGMSLHEWIFNLNTVFSLNIHHLSAYHLAFEPGTLMHQKVQRKEIFPVKEDQSLEQYQKLTEMTEMNGFEQYEISNFSRQGYASQHNSNYWKGIKYIGIGPSAHSYNLKSRQWNISDNIEYIRRISEKRTYYETEHLKQDTRFNEMILTGLRTKWGVNLEEIILQFGSEYYESLFKNAEQFIKNGNLYESNNHFLLTRKGMLIADYIISALFSDEQNDIIKSK